MIMNDLNTGRDISPISRNSRDEDTVTRQTLPKDKVRIGTGNRNARGRSLLSKN